ncbi:MAG: class I SAM-dependent methyltransferase [Chloroflexota bacterium]
MRPPIDMVLRSWADRVRLNREQVDRFREVPDGSDFYAPMAERFRDDPRRTGDAGLEILRSLVQPGETWLDIGAGGGRYALPIALIAGDVIALDASPGMLGVLRQAMDEHGIANVRSIEARWPTSGAPTADVALICNVGYDIEHIGPFVDAMEASARRLCVAMLRWRNPTWGIDQLWPAVHGEPRATLPNLRDFLALLLARDRPYEVRLVASRSQTFGGVDEAMGHGRTQTWVQPGGAKDQKLRATIEERLIERNGRYAFSWEPNYTGIVTWTPAE